MNYSESYSDKVYYVDFQDRIFSSILITFNFNSIESRSQRKWRVDFGLIENTRTHIRSANRSWNQWKLELGIGSANRFDVLENEWKVDFGLNKDMRIFPIGNTFSAYGSWNTMRQVCNGFDVLETYICGGMEILERCFWIERRYENISSRKWRSSNTRHSAWEQI